MGRKKQATIFTYLLMYFLLIVSICSLIPIFVYGLYSINKTISIFSDRANEIISKDVSILENFFSNYENKALVVAQDDAVIELLENNNIGPNDLQLVYSTLFSEFGAIDSACQANLVSIDGKIRLSTHTFPERYDLRFNSNDWQEQSVIRKALDPNSPDLFVTMGERMVTDNANIVFASIVQKIRNSDVEVIGLLIIDLFIEPLKTSLSNVTEEIIIDNNELVGFSFINPTLYGSLNKFKEYPSDSFETFTRQIRGTPFSLRITIESNVYKDMLINGLIILFISLAVGVTLSIIIAIIFSKHSTRRIGMLISSIKKVEEGDLEVVVPDNSGIIEFNDLSKSFNIMTEELKALMQLNREEEAKLAEAERKELENQLNPHFLFNTLNTIKSIANINGEKEIYTITVKLGKLLRESLRHSGSDATVKETLDFVESYLIIQKIRFGDHLNYTIQADDSILNFEIPRLMLQPFVENAVIHGIEPKVENGDIEVIVKDNGDSILFTVTDNGLGFDTSELLDIKNLQGSEHTGIYNTYRRLELRYGDNMKFDISSSKNNGTTINITITREDRKNGKL